MYLQNFDWREILQFLNILNKHITNHGRRNYTFWSQPLKNLHLTMSISCYFCCISISNTVSELWQVVCVCMCAYVCVCVCVCMRMSSLYIQGNFTFPLLITKCSVGHWLTSGFQETIEHEILCTFIHWIQVLDLPAKNLFFSLNNPGITLVSNS